MKSGMIVLALAVVAAAFFAPVGPASACDDNCSKICDIVPECVDNKIHEHLYGCVDIVSACICGEFCEIHISNVTCGPMA